MSQQNLVFAFCLLFLDLPLAFYQLKVLGWVIQLLAALHVPSPASRGGFYCDLGGRSEIRAARGNQGPAQPQLTHRAAISTKQETADPVTHIGSSLETDSWFIRNYTLLDKLGRTKMGGTGAGGTHPQFSQ